MIVAFGFDLCNLFLSHCIDLGCYGFHLCAYFLAEYLEVRFDLLDEFDFRLVGRYDYQFLDVHLCADEVSHVVECLQSLFVLYGDHGFLQRLAHVLFGFLAQREDHRGSLTCQIHRAFEVFVDECLVSFGPIGEVHACAYEVAIEAVGIERCIGCHEQGYGLEAGIKCLVRCLLVGIHLTAPETLAVQSHVPVAEVVLHKVGDSASGFGGFVGVVCLGYLLNEGVEFGEYPKVDLSTTLALTVG